jgi:hypothetical protein
MTTRVLRAAKTAAVISWQILGIGGLRLEAIRLTQVNAVDPHRVDHASAWRPQTPRKNVQPTAPDNELPKGNIIRLDIKPPHRATSIHQQLAHQIARRPDCWSDAKRTKAARHGGLGRRASENFTDPLPPAVSKLTAGTP